MPVHDWTRVSAWKAVPRTRGRGLPSVRGKIQHIAEHGIIPVEVEEVLHSRR